MKGEIKVTKATVEETMDILLPFRNCVALE